MNKGEAWVEKRVGDDGSKVEPHGVLRGHRSIQQFMTFLSSSAI